MISKDGYFKALSDGNELDFKPLNDLFEKLKTHLVIEPIPIGIFAKSNGQPKITEELTRLSIYVARGNNSWGGMIVAFPGSTKQITTEIVGTPYLRRILYPILDLHQRINNHYEESLPCLYLLGSRFPEVLLRKFRLLESLIPHVIILTSDLINSSNQAKERASQEMFDNFPKKINEGWVQRWLCREMNRPVGLKVPIESGDIQVGFLGKEIPASEGTTQPERLDILGYDKSDHSLIAFEIKGPNCSRVELENLFLQGLEHQKWLEMNKMAIKFALDGPNGRRINTRKRVRLLLGFFQDTVPCMYWALREQALKQDKYLQIDFVHFKRSSGNDKLIILSRVK